MNNQDNKDAFEQFLTDETNKHQMFASDAVWANISKQVQTRKSWPALTIVAFLIVIGLSIATFLNYPPDNFLTKAHYNDSVQLIKQEQAAAILAEKPIDDNFETRISSQKITEHTFAVIEKQHQTATIPTTIVLVDEQPKIEPTVSEKIVKHDVAKPAIVNLQPLITFVNEKLPKLDSTVNNKVVAATKQNLQKIDTGEATDNIYKDFYASLLKKRSNKSSRWTYDIYVTPSKSFRKLEDDKERDQYITTLNSSNTNNTASLGNTVKHKPALGLEAGFTIGYNLTNRLKIKAGLQFNIRQYYIDAYQTFGLATIAIVQNNRLDSLTFYSRFGSAGSSYAETKLDNRLYQLSIPLGIQWDAIQGKRLGISFGASVQPTFTLNKNVYLISTDYKYYANGESFFRKWNFNTAIDLNISYKLKYVKLYVGPQIRYQHLPTYNDAYPIKEYRLDYGAKIGIIKGF